MEITTEEQGFPVYRLWGPEGEDELLVVAIGREAAEAWLATELEILEIPQELRGPFFRIGAPIPVVSGPDWSLG